MKTHLFVLVVCVCTLQMSYSQEDDGVVSFVLPVRNSLTFNRYAINPTFSFVREQNKYISIFNKREWVQFEDAPLTYLASYSGRFGENIGAGLGLFQQNYGVLTTFGGVINFAYNVQLERDSNLTFGLNIGAYKSGINTANVVTNFDDPSVQKIPENFLLTINPGINYGLAFFDFGVSINNLALYNFNSSTLIAENPEQGIQAHLMYTGYMSTNGFFDESKFSGLVKSEFRTNETIISATAMLTVPKGIWAQVGYNTLYGASGGLGLNITPQIAIEYNFEKAIGDLTDFGPSHDITLAYRFKNRDTYDYSSGDEVSGLISGDKRRPKAKIAKAKTEVRDVTTDNNSEAQAKLAEEQKLKDQAEVEAQLLAEQKAKTEAEAQAKLVEDQKLKAQAEAEAQLLARQKTEAEAQAQAKRIAQQKAKEQADAQAKLLAEQKDKVEADAEAKRLQAQQATLLAEQKAKEEAEEQARLLADQEAKKAAEAIIDVEDNAINEQISNPIDQLGKSMYALSQQAEASKETQNDLLKQFDDIVDIKAKDLKDLKEENDLSEQGIAVQAKPFKSITAENIELQAIKADLDNIIATRSDKINELKELYDDKFEADTITNDEVYLFYKKTLNRLTTEQKEAIEARVQLETRLEAIKVATEFERRRRIKRAAFDNEDERLSQDRAMLSSIKQTTALSSETLTSEDFDFGEEQNGNIQILKNVQNVDDGYYVILAVHSDVDKRNDFVTKVVASGRTDIDFFYDINTSKYYIYSNKFDSIEEADRAIKSKENQPYTEKMSLVKIEN